MKSRYRFVIEKSLFPEWNKPFPIYYYLINPFL